jgi:hypothetical protein
VRYLFCLDKQLFRSGRCVWQVTCHIAIVLTPSWYSQLRIIESFTYRFRLSV